MHPKEAMEKPRLKAEDFETFGLVPDKANNFFLKARKATETWKLSTNLT